MSDVTMSFTELEQHAKQQLDQLYQQQADYEQAVGSAKKLKATTDAECKTLEAKRDALRKTVEELATQVEQARTTLTGAQQAREAKAQQQEQAAASKQEAAHAAQLRADQAAQKVRQAEARLRGCLTEAEAVLAKLPDSVAAMLATNLKASLDALTTLRNVLPPG